MHTSWLLLPLPLPLQMGDIQGQVAVADINGDGVLEVVAADQRGSVAAFDPLGREVWERHLGSGISTVSGGWVGGGRWLVGGDWLFGPVCVCTGAVAVGRVTGCLVLGVPERCKARDAVDGDWRFWLRVWAGPPFGSGCVQGVCTGSVPVRWAARGGGPTHLPTATLSRPRGA